MNDIEIVSLCCRARVVTILMPGINMSNVGIYAHQHECTDCHGHCQPMYFHRNLSELVRSALCEATLWLQSQPRQREVDLLNQVTEDILNCLCNCHNLMPDEDTIEGLDKLLHLRFNNGHGNPGSIERESSRHRAVLACYIGIHDWWKYSGYWYWQEWQCVEMINKNIKLFLNPPSLEEEDLV